MVILITLIYFFGATIPIWFTLCIIFRLDGRYDSNKNHSQSTTV